MVYLCVQRDPHGFLSGLLPRNCLESNESLPFTFSQSLNRFGTTSANFSSRRLRNDIKRVLTHHHSGNAAVRRRSIAWLSAPRSRLPTALNIGALAVICVVLIGLPRQMPQTR